MKTYEEVIRHHVGDENYETIAAYVSWISDGRGSPSVWLVKQIETRYLERGHATSDEFIWWKGRKIYSVADLDLFFEVEPDAAVIQMIEMITNECMGCWDSAEEFEAFIGHDFEMFKHAHVWAGDGKLYVFHNA